MIEFNDGETLDIDGSLRVEQHNETYYVVGDGIFMPFDNQAAAEEYVYDIEAKNIFCYMKMFRSPNHRRKVAEAEKKEKQDNNVT